MLVSSENNTTKGITPPHRRLLSVDVCRCVWCCMQSSGVSCEGGSVTYQSGYWRPADLVNQGVTSDTVFHKCPEGACITDEVNGTVTCAAGQTGCVRSEMRVDACNSIKCCRGRVWCCCW